MKSEDYKALFISTIFDYKKQIHEVEKKKNSTIKFGNVFELNSKILDELLRHYKKIKKPKVQANEFIEGCRNTLENFVSDKSELTPPYEIKNALDKIEKKTKSLIDDLKSLDDDVLAVLNTICLDEEWEEEFYERVLVNNKRKLNLDAFVNKDDKITAQCVLSELLKVEVAVKLAGFKYSNEKSIKGKRRFVDQALSLYVSCGGIPAVGIGKSYNFILTLFSALENDYEQQDFISIHNDLVKQYKN